MVVGHLFVDHGSRAPQANTSAEKLKDRLSDIGEPVFVCHMELAQPSIRDGFAELARGKVERIVVHPLFFASGIHMQRDVPELCEAASIEFGIPFSIEPPLLEQDAFIEFLRSRVIGSGTTARHQL